MSDLLKFSQSILLCLVHIDYITFIHVVQLILRVLLRAKHRITIVCCFITIVDVTHRVKKVIDCQQDETNDVIGAIVWTHTIQNYAYNSKRTCEKC